MILIIDIIIILICKFLLLTDRRWVCLNNCGRTYLNKKSLIRHLRYECGVKRQFQCSMCFHQFKLQCHLKKHLRKCVSKINDISQYGKFRCM
jgi:hypothetical protein